MQLPLPPAELHVASANAAVVPPKNTHTQTYGLKIEKPHFKTIAKLLPADKKYFDLHVIYELENSYFLNSL